MDKLLQLLNANRAKSSAVKIVAAGDEATVYVYDAIGAYYGVDPQRFVQDLAQIEASTIHLRINTPGGDVFGARAMKTALEAHPARVIAHIDGLSASAGSFLMMAAEETVIAPGAFVMIHDPWSLSIGNSADMRKSADLLDKVGTSIVADYVERTGKGEDEVRAWMQAETWFDADEAVQHGFVNRKAEKAPANASAKAFNLAVYENLPAALKAQTAPSNDNFAAAAAEHERYLARLGLYDRAAA
jgi:ATP-dependent Clp protease protease subunit